MSDVESNKGADMASESTDCSPDVVPFHDADITPEGNRYQSAKATLKGGRTVEVGFAENGDRYIRIERPLADGKRSRLSFGLTLDAAAALTLLLSDSFEENKQNRHP